MAARPNTRAIEETPTRNRMPVGAHASMCDTIGAVAVLTKLSIAGGAAISIDVNLWEPSKVRPMAFQRYSTHQVTVLRKFL